MTPPPGLHAGAAELDELKRRMSDISERLKVVEDTLQETINDFRKDLKYIVDHIKNINERPDGGFVVVPMGAP